MYAPQPYAMEPYCADMLAQSIHAAALGVDPDAPGEPPVPVSWKMFGDVGASPTSTMPPIIVHAYRLQLLCQAAAASGRFDHSA